MTRYYFDVVEDGRTSVDTEGTELPDANAARVEATLALAEIARDALPGTRRKEITMTVRDQYGGPRFTLELRFRTVA
jgi:hypothetical protein